MKRNIILERLDVLMENTEVEQIKKKIGDNVPQNVMGLLASKMKPNRFGDRYFDNEAMAILSGIQKCYPHGEYSKYVVDNPTKIYLILKKAKRGNTSFNAKEAVENGMLGTTGESAEKYWTRLYRGNSDDEDRNFSSLGKGKYRTKELSDSLLIFPDVYRTDRNGYREIDYEKSADNLRRISADIARQDKSNEISYDSYGEEPKFANANHWCVASSDKSYYEGYSKEPLRYLFVIVIKKGKDGKPDIGERFLAYSGMYGSPREYDDESRDIFEFADKFDRHVNFEEVFDRNGETARFLNKMLYSDLRGKNPKKEVTRETFKHEKHEESEAGYKEGRPKYVKLSQMGKTEKENLRKIYNDVVYRATEREDDERIRRSLKELMMTNMLSSYLFLHGGHIDNVWFNIKDGKIKIRYRDGEYYLVFNDEDEVFRFIKGKYNPDAEPTNGFMWDNDIDAYPITSSSSPGKSKHPAFQKIRDAGYKEGLSQHRAPFEIRYHSFGNIGYRIVMKNGKHEVYKLNKNGDDWDYIGNMEEPLDIEERKK